MSRHGNCGRMSLLAMTATAASLFATFSFADTIIVNGVCNIIQNGSNNISYGNPCSPTGTPRSEIFDPPGLWLGMDIVTVRKLIGGRNPVEGEQNGRPVIMASGRLFGLDGDTKYGFDASSHLAWMSVEAQCTEDRHDYLLTKVPPDLSPDWLEWRQTAGVRLEYEKLTKCSQIENLSKTLPKLFGEPSADLSPGYNSGRTPGKDEVCESVAKPFQPCSDTHAVRTTLDREFIGTDRVTGIGYVVRDLRLSATVQEGDYWPIIRRREMVGVVSIWGSDGRPTIEPSVYGHLRFYLQAELP